MSADELLEVEQAAPSGARELLHVLAGVAIFALVGPIVLGAVLFIGVVASSLVYDATDAFIFSRPFDPQTSLIVAAGLMLVLLRFGWTLVLGSFLGMSGFAGAAVALKHVVLGGASWRFAVATGLAVGLVADIFVVLNGHPLLGGARIAIMAGWILVGSLIASLACWRLAGAIRPA